METAAESGKEDRDWKQDLAAAARHVSSGVLGGLVTGAVIGGIGGRLAMVVLRLTSDPALHGVETDDGFTIGSFTGSTIFLILLTAVAGVLGGLFYLIVRRWLPERWRPLLMAIFGGAVGGAIVVHPGGVDFTALDPLVLAIAMFIALPAIYGAALSVLVERLLRPGSWLQRPRVWFAAVLPLIPLAALGPAALVLVVLMVGLWAFARVAPAARELWVSQPVTWLGRAGLLAATLWALVALTRDITQIL